MTPTHSSYGVVSDPRRPGDIRRARTTCWAKASTNSSQSTTRRRRRSWSLRGWKRGSRTTRQSPPRTPSCRCAASRLRSRRAADTIRRAFATGKSREGIPVSRLMGSHPRYAGGPCMMRPMISSKPDWCDSPSCGPLAPPRARAGVPGAGEAGQAGRDAGQEDRLRPQGPQKGRRDAQRAPPPRASKPAST